MLATGEPHTCSELCYLHIFFTRIMYIHFCGARFGSYKDDSNRLLFLRVFLKKSTRSDIDNGFLRNLRAKQNDMTYDF